jgi:uncharacterized protein (TIGR02147 family)
VRPSETNIAPSAYLDYRLYLAAVYDAVKAQTASYSYKTFASDLGFGATTVMHQIVRGHRPLTVKAAKDVAAPLGLKGIERRYFLILVEYGNAKLAAKRDELFKRLLELKGETLAEDLDRDVLDYFSAWWHPVVRELVGTPRFQADPEWIAKQIMPRIRPEQARESLALLERLNLVQRDASGVLTQTQTRISTGHRVKGMALVGYHREMIDHGREALSRVPAKRRDISAMTVAVDEATAQRLKAMIHAFQLQLLDEAERASGKDQVYQVNIQLFPFTEPET